MNGTHAWSRLGRSIDRSSIHRRVSFFYVQSVRMTRTQGYFTHTTCFDERSGKVTRTREKATASTRSIDRSIEKGGERRERGDRPSARVGSSFRMNEWIAARSDPIRSVRRIRSTTRRRQWTTRRGRRRRDARAIDRSSAIPDADEGEGDERDDGRMLDVDVDDADDLGGGANRW